MDIVNTHQAEAWNGYEGRHWADNHERYNRVNSSGDERLFEAAAIGRDHRVLDIGCGTGYTARKAAALATRGHVAGIDLSGPQLERARRLAEEEGITNITFEQGDAQIHPFPPAHFDVAISRGGIMYFADPVAAFANIGKALKPGGRLVFGCGRDHGEDESGALWGAMAAHIPVPDIEQDDSPGPAGFLNEERITEVLTEAGFTAVTPTPVQNLMVYGRDAEDATEFIFGMGPIRHWLRDVDTAVEAKAREAVTAALRPFETEAGAGVRVPAWVFSAVWDPAG